MDADILFTTCHAFAGLEDTEVREWEEQDYKVLRSEGELRFYFSPFWRTN
ncbi:hypothetical protein N8648_04620 [Verrucomicrobia bacterium]|nr:hypothetical protein [Verrucomicrobiota bacterium]